MSEQQLTQFLGRYIAEGEPKALPALAVESATELFLDTIGVMLVGAIEPCASIARRVAVAMGGGEQASVVGSPTRSSVTNAALVNGTAAHALDLDDSHHPGMLHPSAVLVPAVLALAEGRAIGGRQALGAYVYGLDLVAAIGHAVNPSHYDLGWHPTCTLGTIAAAGACAKVLDLNAEETVAALSIAMSESSGIRRNFGSMTKPLHAGIAASNGILAALLAEEGLSVGDAVLEGDRGWLDLMAPRGAWRASDVTGILDHGFALALEGLAIKRFASCGVTHPPIEAALRLRELGVRPADVVALRLVVHPMAPQISSFTNPRTGLEAKFSLPHCVAVALVTGRAGLGEFTDSSAADAQLVALRHKVEVVTDPTVGLAGHMSWGCLLSATTADGGELSVEVEMARGKWMGERLAHEEVVAKYRECCAAAGVDSPAAERCLDLLERLDELSDVGELMDAVRAAAS